MADLFRFQIHGTEKDWEKVKLNEGSNVVSIKSTESTKKKKRKNVTEEISTEAYGKGGVYDPKGMLKKGKKKVKV